MLKTKSIAVAAASLLACSSLAALSGCAVVDKAKEAFSNTEVGQKVTSSKTSDKEDYANYSSIQDVNGNLYATVIEMTKIDDNDISIDELKSILSSYGVNWYQAIVADARGTNQQEVAHLFFTSDATLSDLNKLCDMLSDTYDAHVMTLTEYEDYAKKAQESTNLYYVEGTYFGPAAGK